jgi:hypothetical protein
MRNSFIRIAVLAVCLLSNAAAANDAAVRKELQAEYARYDTVVLKGMGSLAKWCEEKLASEFVMVTPGDKPMKRGPFIASIKQLAKKPDPSWKGIKEQKTTIDKLESAGTGYAASITVRGSFDTTDTTGEFGEKGKDHRLTLVRKYRETWSKCGAAWKIAKSEMTGGSMLVDGKPMGEKK